MTQFHLKALLLSITCLVSSCGMEPSGGNSGSSAAATNGTNKPSVVSKEETKGDNTEEKNSSDAVQAGVAVLPEEMSDLNTDEVIACHTQGNIFNRRTERCSKTVKLATSYTCDKAGITDAFKLTGYQIDEALKAAQNDAFVLDQCGETASGQMIAYFVRADDDGTYSIREIETKIPIK